MAKISVDLIRQRLDVINQKRRYFEWKSDHTPTCLERHEVWRHTYLTYPYLVGAPDERVADRFRSILFNATEIGEQGKITLVPFRETDLFMQVFTHMLEEYEARNLEIPANVARSAAEPFHKYFENGDPLGIKMFSNYKAPESPIVVKYGKRQFLESMLKKGSLRIANAKSYNSSKLIDAIRDDETSRAFFVPTYRERLEGKSHIFYQNHKIEFNDDDIELPILFDDYYLFSLCSHIHYRMPTDFDADSAIIIKNPNLFTQRVISAFLIHFPDWIPMVGKVTYYDPYRDHSKIKGTPPHMMKHFGYSYQKEYRIAFRSHRPGMQKLKPLFLSIGTMEDYADLVSI